MSCDPEQHKLHMCALTSRGEDDCIKTLADNPTVQCANCGALANNPQNVCEPQPLSHIRAAVA